MPETHQRRVLYCLDEFPKVSETFISLEIELMRELGWVVDVVALRPSDLGRVPGVTYLDDVERDRRRVALSHARAVMRPLRYAQFLRAARSLGPERQRVRWRALPSVAHRLRTRPDWLHAHFAWSGAAVALMLSALIDVRWSMTLHARDIFADRRSLPLKLDAADELVTVCEYNRQWLHEVAKVDREVHLVVCGVRVPDVLDREPEPGLVLGIGRLVEKKGFDVLVAAARRMVDRGEDIRVVIVGDGPDRESLSALIARHGLQDVVCLAGAMEHHLALKLLERASLLCLPARIAGDGDRDSMPLVLKEAMARGVPVVATRVTGIPEVVDETVGWLVPPNDDQALADALAEAMANPAGAREKGRAGRARVLDQFTLEHEVGKLSALLAQRSGAAR